MKPDQSPNIKNRDIEQQSVYGQNSAIRSGDPKNEEDIQRMKEVLNSEGHTKYFTNVNTKPYTNEDAKDRLAQDPYQTMDAILQGKEKIYSTFIISGSMKRHDSETGKLQGRIGFSIDQNGKNIHPQLDKIREKLGLVTLKDSKYPRLEMTWEKHPEAKEKQTASGVRQVLWEIFKRTTSVTETKRESIPHKGFITTIYKYEHLEDLEPSSIEVMETEKANHTKRHPEDKIEFDTNIVVVAYIEPDNQDSIRVAESAGFVKIYTDKSNPPPPHQPHDIYQVDWRILQEKITTKSLHY